MKNDMGLRIYAEKVRKAGQRGDKVLAHINVHEANELARKYGFDINPHTGLPQFGKFKLKKLIKNVARIAAPVIGHMIAGPVGAGIGGGLARGATSGGNFFKNFGRGALPAAGISALASTAGGAMGSPFLSGGQGLFGMQGPQSGFLGKAFGTGPGSLTGGLNQFGSGMVGGGNSARMAAINSLRGVGQGGGPTGYGGGDKGGEGGGGLLSSLGGGLNTALLGAGLAGTLMRREKVTPQQISDERAELERLRNMPTGDITASYSRWGHEYQPKKGKSHKRKYIHPVQTEGEPIFFDEVNPEIEYMAAGGYVQGNSGGAQDNRNTRIPEGSYVMNSTDLSLLGDGNSNKGADEVAELERRFLQSGLTRNHGLYRDMERPRYIDVHLSDGEYVLDPRVVTAIGKGNNERGAKILDKGRRKLRQDKGMKHILPPKSKPIASYLR